MQPRRTAECDFRQTVTLEKALYSMYSVSVMTPLCDFRGRVPLQGETLRSYHCIHRIQCKLKHTPLGRPEKPIANHTFYIVNIDLVFVLQYAVRRTLG